MKIVLDTFQFGVERVGTSPDGKPIRLVKFTDPSGIEIGIILIGDDQAATVGNEIMKGQILTASGMPFPPMPPMNGGGGKPL